MVSLALHGALCGYFYRTNFIPSATLAEQRVPVPTFKVRSVEMQPLEQPSADQTNPASKPEADKTDVQLPDEKKSFDQLLDEVHASAALPDDTRDVLPDTPQVDQSNPELSPDGNRAEHSADAFEEAQTRPGNRISSTDSATSGRPHLR